MSAFLFVDPAVGQFTTEWEMSENEGNRPTYVSTGDYTARGLAYGMVDDGDGNMVERIFIASNENGPYRIYVVNPSDGALLDSLDVSGIKEDGFRFLNDVGVSEDGLIIACNAARGDFGLAQPFHCYRWDDLTAAPTQIIDGAAMEERVGSNISVTGAASDNSLLIHTAAVASNNDLGDALYRFSTDDNGSSFMTDTLFTSAEGATPNVEDAYPAPGGGYYHTWVNEPAQQYDASENETGQIPTGVADSLVSLTIFEAEGETFLAGAKNHYAGGTPQGADSRVRVANITNGADNATMYGQTSDLGDTEQFQGNGDVDVRVNDDATATFFFLSTNNGIAAFTTNQGPLASDPGPITVDGQTDDAKYRPLGTSPADQPADSPTPAFTGGVVGLNAYAGPDSLYVALEGKFRNGQGDGTFRDMLLFVNSSNVDGVDAGTLLPAGSAGDSPFGYVDSTRMDMETDFGVRVTGGNSAVGYVSIADYAGYVAGDSTSDGKVMDDYEGSVDDVGSPTTGGAYGGVYAYDDTSDIGTVDGTGWEMAIPHSALGTSSADKFQFFAVYGDVEGDTLSATLVPDDGETTFYRNDEDWTAVAGMQATGSRTIPVELASFDARRDGQKAVLSWKTASETNNAGFAVQHAIGSGDFEQVGWVEGAGTTTEAQTYQFVAEDLSAGTHRFRLKQEDLDGSTSLSEVVEVDVRPDGPVAIQKVAPNPVTGTATLRFTMRESGSVTVGLYDVLGRQVKTLHEGRVTGGQPQQVTLDASTVSSGVYFLRVKGEGFTKTRRLTVVQ
jgi:hypothetical protein